MTEKEKAILGFKAKAFDELAEIVDNTWEYCFGNTAEGNNSRIALLGAVYGILEFVKDAIKALKENEDEA